MSDKHRPVTVYFACPLCKNPLDVRMSKKGKPYVTCGDCALQLFVRGTAGIERFGKLVHSHSQDSNEPASLPIPEPEPKLPRGRPRKHPDITRRVERVASVSPLDVLTGRTP